MRDCTTLFKRVALSVALAVGSAFASPAHAALVASYDSALGAGADTAFDAYAYNNDLINSGQPTIASAATSPGPLFGFPGLNNGVAAHSTTHSTFYTSTQLPSTVTFQLNTSQNTNGYTIQSLQSLAGWTGVNITQANQKFELLTRQVGSSTFVSHGTFTNAPFFDQSKTGASTRTVLTSPVGIIAQRVDAVQLRLQYPGLTGNGDNPGTVYREIDVLGVASAPQVNLIQNGSFESPTLAANSHQPISTGAGLTGWNTTGNVALVRGMFGTVASHGAQWLSLESTAGAPNNFGTISQTFATVPGTLYDLAFDYNALGASSITNPWQLTYNVGDGPVTLTIPNPANLTLGTWLHEQTQFIATGATTTLSFTGMAQRDGFYGAALDNVFVAVAVPEPSTLLLAAVGGIALLAARRRRG